MRALRNRFIVSLMVSDGSGGSAGGRRGARAVPVVSEPDPCRGFAPCGLSGAARHDGVVTDSGVFTGDMSGNWEGGGGFKLTAGSRNAGEANSDGGRWISADDGVTNLSPLRSLSCCGSGDACIASAALGPIGADSATTPACPAGRPATPSGGRFVVITVGASA